LFIRFALISSAEIMREYFHHSRKFQHFIDLAITGAVVASAGFNAT
jgi:hypothetical protein